MEALEVIRWLRSVSVRGYYCRGRHIEIPYMVEIGDSSPTDNFNDHATTNICDSSPADNFNNHAITNISDSSPAGNFNNHATTNISDSSSAGNFNNHAGPEISDSGSGRNRGYTATGSSDSSPDHSSSGHNNNNTACGFCYSFDNFEQSSQPLVTGTNCQIHGKSHNDCSWGECKAFL